MINARESRERIAEARRQRETPPRDVLIEGLVKGLGYSRTAAAAFVDRYTVEVVMVMTADTGEQES